MNIETIVQNQRDYYLTHATKTIVFRLNMLRRLQTSINEFEPEILSALKSDLNKPALEAYMTEVGPTRYEIRFARKHLRSWMRTKTVKTPVINLPGNSFIVPEPYGVITIFSTWNYPFSLCLEPLVGSIAAGNCSIIKSSELAPATSKVVAKLIAATFDPKYIAVIEGGIDESTELLKQKLDYMFFTGSMAVGKIIMRAASENLTPITLELGGKSPCIVTQSANIKLAAKQVAFGKFINAEARVLSTRIALIIIAIICTVGLFLVYTGR